MGRLALGRGQSTLSVYFMHGEIVGAIGPNDDRHLVRRLLLNERITSTQAKMLNTVVVSGKSIMRVLFDLINDETLQFFLFQRFLDNLCLFLSSTAGCQFESLSGVFIDNLQVGHDTQKLFEQCNTVCSKAFQLELDIQLSIGANETDDPVQRTLAEMFRGGRVMSELLDVMPLEPMQARASIFEMLQAGVLMRTSEEEELLYGAMVEEERFHTDDSVEELGTEEIEMLSEEIEFTATKQELPENSGNTESHPSTQSPESTESPDTWLEPELTEDDVMEAFNDYDNQRGIGGGGAFSTERQHLERIEVMELDFPGPNGADNESSGSDAIVQAKVAVANQVLQTVSNAFETSQGSGSGARIVQALFDSTPHHLKVLFKGLHWTNGGTLDEASIIANLSDRPETEHRRLLHQAMLDVIERALSTAADELSDELVDEVLESTAGYRQRLGA